MLTWAKHKIWKRLLDKGSLRVYHDSANLYTQVTHVYLLKKFENKKKDR